MSTARTFPPQEGGNLILSKRRVVFGFCAGRFFLLLTDFVCRRVLRTAVFLPACPPLSTPSAVGPNLRTRASEDGGAAHRDVPDEGYLCDLLWAEPWRGTRTERPKWEGRSLGTGRDWLKKGQASSWGALFGSL